MMKCYNLLHQTYYFFIGIYIALWDVRKDKSDDNDKFYPYFANFLRLKHE